MQKRRPGTSPLAKNMVAVVGWAVPRTCLCKSFVSCIAKNSDVFWTQYKQADSCLVSELPVISDIHCLSTFLTACTEEPKTGYDKGQSLMWGGRKTRPRYYRVYGGIQSERRDSERSTFNNRPYTTSSFLGRTWINSESSAVLLLYGTP